MKVITEVYGYIELADGKRLDLDGSEWSLLDLMDPGNKKITSLDPEGDEYDDGGYLEFVFDDKSTLELSNVGEANRFLEEYRGWRPVPVNVVHLR